MPTLEPNHAPHKPYRARIRMYGRSVHLGYYASYREALRVEEKERALYQKEKEFLHG